MGKYKNGKEVGNYFIGLIVLIVRALLNTRSHFSV